MMYLEHSNLLLPEDNSSSLSWPNPLDDAELHEALGLENGANVHVVVVALEVVPFVHVHACGEKYSK